MERFNVKTELLIKLELISDNFEKCLEYFDKISETSSNSVLIARKQLTTNYPKQCSVKLINLTTNEFKSKSILVLKQLLILYYYNIPGLRTEKTRNAITSEEEEVYDDSIVNNSGVNDSENVCKEVDNNLSEDNVNKDITDNDINNKTNERSEGLSKDCDDIQSSGKSLKV